MLFQEGGIWNNKVVKIGWEKFRTSGKPAYLTHWDKEVDMIWNLLLARGLHIIPIINKNSLL